MPFETVAGRAFYRACHWTTFYGFTFGWGLRVAGREHLSRAGPVLLVSNHQSFLDPVLIGAGATRALTYLARSSLWENRALGHWIDRWGAVPIDRGFGRDGLHTVLAQLDRGRMVLMFPEGERTHTGDLGPLKPGISLLVKRVTCPIIPVGIAGAFEAWPRQRKWPTLDPLWRASRGRSMSVAFGPPVDPAGYKGPGRDELLAHLSVAMSSAYDHARRIRRKPASGPRPSRPLLRP